MELSSVLDARVLAPLIAGSAMLVLSVAFWAFDFENRLYRAFAVFLLLRGVANVGSGLLWVPEWNAYWVAVTPYAGIALPFSAAYLAYVYRIERLGARLTPWPLVGLVATAAALEWAYLFDHRLWSGRDPQDSIVFGPLFLLVGALYLVYAGLAHMLTREFLRRPPAKRPASAAFAAVGFALTPVHVGGYSILTLFLPSGAPGSGSGGPPPLFAILAVVLFALGFLLVLPSVRSLWKEARRPDGSPAARAVYLLALPAATAVLGAVLRLISRDDSLAFVHVFDGIWALVFVLIVGYAILRHQLFDVDVRFRISVQRGTLAAFFVATFFVASELAQTYFSDRFDWIVGTLAAGLLVFAISPLHHLAERFSRATLPQAKSVAGMSHRERILLYREQLEIAWADGSLSHKERRMLDTSRERLHLSYAETAKLENEVVTGGGIRKGRA